MINEYLYYSFQPYYGVGNDQLLPLFTSYLLGQYKAVVY